MATWTSAGSRDVVVFKHRERAAFLGVAAVAILSAHFVDVLAAGGRNWPAFWVRLGWAVMVALTGAVVWSGHLTAMRWVGGASALGSAVFFLLLVQVTGRAGSPVLSFAYALAITLPFIMPELLGPALAASTVLVAGTIWTIAADPGPPGMLAGWAHVGAVALLLGALMAWSYRSARLAEQGEAAARQEALRRLAEVERQRGVDLQAAAVGRLAADVAHEINSPLAAARANAAYLLERAGADPDGAEACRDLVVTLDRIGEAVRRLRQEAAGQ